VVEQCPRCGGRDVHHSRMRNWVERLRGRVTSHVPFRCYDCEWRGWSDDAAARQRTPYETRRILHRAPSDEDLDQLDGDVPGSTT
jgi:hypothetical protein